MKIIKHGSFTKTKTMTGTCQQCGCMVEVKASETTELVDRDTTAGSATKHVACPECDNKFLWVR